jgi:hypothetical protein
MMFRASWRLKKPRCGLWTVRRSLQPLDDGPEITLASEPSYTTKKLFLQPDSSGIEAARTTSKWQMKSQTTALLSKAPAR